MGLRHLADVMAMEETFDSAAQRMVYLELAFWADRRGIIRISQVEIASRCLLAPRTVVAQVQALEAVGLIKRLEHGRYAFHFPPPEGSRERASSVTTKQAGVDAELERLKALRQPGEGIYFTRQGWPVLEKVHQEEFSSSESE